jgi:cytoskeletal protein CcmA (bactofilin family)
MMWDKKDAQRDQHSAPQQPHYEPRTAAAPSFNNMRTTQTANLGPSLNIKGEVSGSEDLTIDGRVEGRIDLKDHNLTSGANGKVHAEIHARNITVIGEVTGNVAADEKVDLTDTAKVVGDIKAPRISISDGAQFKGSVEMGGAEKSQQRSQSQHQNAQMASAGHSSHASGSMAQAAQVGRAGQ